ncbi:uncharacterized protein LOC119595724 [Penaeus monodon]|uniref:uncharacterized protein LOC119595724 n=1 Tax=Penaeus monodon TaxID=6687 RepID=UPI0018A77C44|nr:uncharacterized protein LOC119595724 [Penaeus monodon]
MILRVLAASALLVVCAGQGCETTDLVCKNWSPAGPVTVNHPCPADCSTKDNPSASCYIQNDCDCTSYFICQDDVYTLTCCERGLYWDMEIRICDDLEHANCDSRPYETLPPTTATVPSTTDSTASEPVTPVTMTTEPPTPPPAIEEQCSSLSLDDVLYLPNEADCHMYYKCSMDYKR